MEVLGDTLCSDEPDMTIRAIEDWIKKGAEMVVCTGGMSVDPDDRTPLAIRTVADEADYLWRPGFAGSHVYAGLCRGDTPYGTARLCDVC